MQTTSPLAKLAFVAALLAVAVAVSSALPSLPALFSRLHPAARGQHPAQQHQADPREQILAASSLVPVFNGYPHLRQGDLMRLSAMQLQRPNYFPLEAAAAQFRPQLDAARRPAQEQVSALHLPLENYRDQSHSELSFATPAASGEPVMGQVHSRPLETSHSEVVDKIERHIGQQIEASLSAGASAYQQPAPEHSAAASGEESEGEEEHHEEPKAEKRHEEHHEHHHHHEEPKHEEPKHEEHEEHHEGAPEAFEVHHKKGGKSFQYFHQGHGH